MNVKLLKEIKARIAAEPSWFNMDWWFAPSNGSSCGTAACIAGWAKCIEVMKEQPTLKFGEVCHEREGSGAFMDGMRLLQIDTDQAERLFYTRYWPKRFEVRYKNAANVCERAKAACDRIDFFIQTNGTDKEEEPAVTQ